MSDKLSLKTYQRISDGNLRMSKLLWCPPQATQLNFDLPSSPFLHGSRGSAIMQAERDSQFKETFMIKVIYKIINYDKIDNILP